MHFRNRSFSYCLVGATDQSTDDHQSTIRNALVAGRERQQLLTESGGDTGIVQTDILTGSNKLIERLFSSKGIIDMISKALGQIRSG